MRILFVFAVGFISSTADIVVRSRPLQRRKSCLAMMASLRCSGDPLSAVGAVCEFELYRLSAIHNAKGIKLGTSTGRLEMGMISV